MYQNLRLRNLKGLRQCEVTDLGQINVICGKNNSGKSTLLEAIVTADKSSPGRKLTPEDMERLWVSTAPRMGWGSVDRDREENRTYLAILRTIHNEEKTWYLDERESFVQLLKDQFARRGLGHWVFAEGDVGRCFDSLFPRDKTVLVPPKRTLEVSRLVESAESVLPTGAGLLNYLFFAKNQHMTSPDSQVYAEIRRQFELISSGYQFDVFLD